MSGTYSIQLDDKSVWNANMKIKTKVSANTDGSTLDLKNADNVFWHRGEDEFHRVLQAYHLFQTLHQVSFITSKLVLYVMGSATAVIYTIVFRVNSPSASLRLWKVPHRNSIPNFRMCTQWGRRFTDECVKGACQHFHDTVWFVKERKRSHENTWPFPSWKVFLARSSVVLFEDQRRWRRRDAAKRRFGKVGPWSIYFSWWTFRWIWKFFIDFCTMHEENYEKLPVKSTNFSEYPSYMA